MPPRSKGGYAVKRQKPRKQVSTETIIYEVPFVGPYTALEASEPAIGSPLAGFNSAFLVTKFTLESTGGGTGRMVVTIESPKPGTPTGTSINELAESIYESDYAEERLPIESHFNCGILKSDRPFYDDPSRKESTEADTKNKRYADHSKGKPRTWEHWSVLDADDYQKKSSSGWSLGEYQAMKEAGIDFFPVNYPICTATTYHRFRPASGVAINKVGTPPAACSPPAGYTYVKSGDRITKQGRLYTRVQSWRGYKGLEANIFS